VNLEEVMEVKDLPEDLQLEFSLNVEVVAIDEKLLLLLRPNVAKRLAAAKAVIDFKPIIVIDLIYEFVFVFVVVPI
jgi:hypothetical protein